MSVSQCTSRMEAANASMATIATWFADNGARAKSRVLEMYLGRLEEAYNKHEEAAAQLESIIFTKPDEAVQKREIAVLRSMQSEFDKAYLHVKEKFVDRQEELQMEERANDDPPVPPRQQHSSAEPMVHLQRLEVAQFDGERCNWADWWSSFRPAVDQNGGLTAAMKFLYLKRAIGNSRAASIIKGLEPSEANYAVAVKLLKAEYENKSLVVNDHIAALVEAPHVEENNVRSLREFADRINSHTKALSSLKRNIEGYADVLLFILRKKCDKATQRAWYKETKEEEFPTIATFKSFLADRLNLLERLGDRVASPERPTMEPKLADTTRKRGVDESRVSPATKQQALVSGGASKRPRLSCPICLRQDHSIYRCTVFTSWPMGERRAFLRKKNLCLNCLKPHAATNCPSKQSCRVCQERHNTLLHESSSRAAKGASLAAMETDSSEQEASPTVHHSDEELSLTPPRMKSVVLNPHQPPGHKQSGSGTSHQQVVGGNALTASDKQHKRGTVMLGTAVVDVVDAEGRAVPCRALLDSGSSLDFVCNRVVQNLGLPQSKKNTKISGIGGVNLSSTKISNFKIKSRFNRYTFSINAHVVPRITSLQPKCLVDVSELDLPAGIQLADPNFDSPQKIDLLLGAEHFFALLKPGRMELSVNTPTIAQETELGWLVVGPAPIVVPSAEESCHVVESEQEESLETLLMRFWSVEDPEPNRPTRSLSDEACEEYFCSTIKQDDTGRFITRLPFRNPPETLGKTFFLAKRWFERLEQRFKREPELKEPYKKFMNEFIEMGHMQELPANEKLPDPHFITPHHGVLRPEASSTRLRVVFNAAARSTSGHSLNDTLHVGPVVQPELYDILVRFRFFSVVIVADIAKMFRQIIVDPEDAKFQLVLWRKTDSSPIRIYRVDRLMYGLSCSPYIATRSINLLAEKHAKEFPAASKAILQHTYMDNIMSGAATAGEAIELMHQLQQLLLKGCFPLHKYASNEPDVLREVDETVRDKQLSLGDGTEAVSALGLKWDNDDCFRFVVSPRVVPVLTKRGMLAEIARISYDPLGLIAPVTVVAKILMQKTWKMDISWDETLPAELNQQFQELMDQLHVLKELKIPRKMIPDQASGVQMHAFSDASERAYGTAIYIRAQTNEGISVRLLTAKSRVAPAKAQSQSLARLELNAALMAAELVQRLRQIITIDIQLVYFWTDSEIVLHWIAGDASRWPTYVRNRVAKIQRQSKQEEWRFVPGTVNPADIVSRGMMPLQLLHDTLWFKGPEFLSYSQDQWPQTRETTLEATLEPNTMPESCLIVNKGEEIADWVATSKFCNSYSKLLRVTAIALRFIHNAKARCPSKANQPSVTGNQPRTRSGPLQAIELEEALKRVVQCVQAVAFPADIAALTSQRKCPKTSKIRNLFPFLDADGTIRIGGRLRNAKLERDRAYPMVLPSNHPFTLALARHYHQIYLHVGARNLLAQIRHRFWPLQGIRMCRRVIHKCHECFRAAPRLAQQLIGDLPAARVQPSRPFLVTGLDFAGPFQISPGGRGRVLVKAYVCLFTCFSTRAVHLELTSELSTNKTLEAIERFASRRGLPAELFSDNMKGFIGAANQLAEVQEGLERGEGALYKWSLENKVKWRFIPARSPHHGGAWESLIGVVKTHLARVISLSNLTREEAETLLARIEAIVNSRPLQALSDDPDELDALTPAHFLIGQPITALPEQDIEVSDGKLGLLKRYHRVVALKRSFWIKWRLEYLQELRRAAKWTDEAPNLQIGQLVMLQDDNLPPMQWSLGRIVDLHPGEDGIVRVVSIRTTTGKTKRDVRRIAPLPVQDFDSRNQGGRHGGSQPPFDSNLGTSA